MLTSNKILIHHFPNLDSTQLEARRLVKNQSFLQKLEQEKQLISNQWILISANKQEKGFGQKSRKWLSSKGNIYVTYIFNISNHYIKDSIFIPYLTIQSVIKLCEENQLCNVKYKWPNDILIKEKKISGILIEKHKISEDYYTFLVAMGINVNASQSTLNNIMQKTTSFFIEKKRRYDINILIQHLSELLYENVRNFFLIDKENKKNSLYYKKNLLLKNINLKLENFAEKEKKVITINNKQFIGKIKKIGNKGQLFLFTSQGIVEIFTGNIKK